MKLITECCLTAALLLASQLFSFAGSRANVKSLSVDDGLSQSMVYCICQDSRGFMWFGTQDGLNRYDGHSFKVYRAGASDAGAVSGDRYFCSFRNDDSRIWFGTGRGIEVYDPGMERFSSFLNSGFGETVDFCVRTITKDSAGDIWIAGDSPSIYCYTRGPELLKYPLAGWAGTQGIDASGISVRGVHRDGNTLYVAAGSAGFLALDLTDGSVVSLKSDSGRSTAVEATCLIPWKQDVLLVGTANAGVLSFDCRKSGFARFIPGEDASEAEKLYVRCLLKASDGRIWAGTESGVYVCDPRDRSVETFRHIYGDPYSLSDNAVHSLAEDRDGGIWVGTFFGGVNYFASSSPFQKYYPIPGANSISGRCISEICQDKEQNLWIATEDAGLNKFDPVSGVFSPTPVPATNVHALLSDGNILWAGTFSEGLFRLDTRLGTFRRFRAAGRNGSLLSDDIYSIFKDSYGVLWVGTSAGLNRYLPDTDTFVAVKADEIIRQVNDIREDWRGRLWFAALGGGVWSYDRDKDEWKHYGGEDEGSLISGAVCLAFDKSGNIWVGTNGHGVFEFDRETDSFAQRFDSGNGLPNDVVYSLVSDRFGALWGSTNKGLFKIDPVRESVVCYTKDNGLLCDQFNFKSGFLASDGTMYFGGISGFVSFVPEDLPETVSTGNVLLSSLWINNREVTPADPSIPLLQRSIAETECLEIPPPIAVFGIDVTEINYSPSSSHTFYCKLENWDKVWMPVSLPTRLSWSNLPYGTYRLRVCESPDEDSVELAGLKIVIRPPFWLSDWAFVIYAVLIAGVAAGCAYLARRRVLALEQRRKEKIEEEKEKEIYEAKIGFFSNITHEIRTPLSLIKLPLNEMIGKAKPSNPEYGNLLTIRDNTDRLLNLVNQLLDFRKVNARTHKPVFVHSSISSVAASVISRFDPSAKIKGIGIDRDIPERFYADVDVEMFVKMTSNLLNNALKHAHTTIGIAIRQENEDFVLSVSNDGDRIPPESAGKLFTPFFKVQQDSDGFGIGLSLVRSLAELHGGGVRYFETEEGHTCFEIRLPLTQPDSFRIDTKRERETETEQPETENSLLDSEKKVVLMVDDDVEFLDYISNLLESTFRVIRATNGNQAWKLIGRKSIDIIISDIVMPDMDGRTLCRKIKEDLRYRHIPVILLSSETTTSAAKSEAYSCGADFIVDKPFYYEFLIACISNLLKSHYIAETSKFTGEQCSDNLVFTRADDGFINSLIEMIQSHIEDVDLNIDKLASMMNMSRATLYRKTSEVLKVTPNDFIRLIRLKKAAELLRQGEYRVNEIAYIVGFSSSSYFSKCFFKQFGVLPKDFK